MQSLLLSLVSLWSFSLPQNGATPLHLASKYGHVELVRQLCVAGCDVNAVTEHGFTADEVAANSSHDELATLIHTLRQVQVYYNIILLQCCLQLLTKIHRIFIGKRISRMGHLHSLDDNYANKQFSS